MRNRILLIVAVFFAFSAVAQPPLSKRDQKRLEAFEKELADEKKYGATIAKAEKAFEQSRYVDARMLYNEAIDYNEKNRAWLTAKVNDLDILMAKNIARSIDSLDVVGKRGVESIQLDRPTGNGLAIREMNMTIKPLPKDTLKAAAPEVTSIEDGDVEVVETIAVVEDPNPSKELPEGPVEEEIKTKTQVVTKPKPEETVPRIVTQQSKPEPAEEKPKEVYDEFPQGFTRDVFTFPNHEVTRVVVKDGIDTIIYKKVTHRWGGKFYFKDEVSVPERIWLQQVEQYRKRFGAEVGD